MNERKKHTKSTKLLGWGKILVTARKKIKWKMTLGINISYRYSITSNISPRFAGNYKNFDFTENSRD